MTSKDFGSGKQNTANMIEAWNNKKYGEQDAQDIWGQVEDGWFMPSITEWYVFKKAFNITYSNYKSHYGLSLDYWSSSLVGTGFVSYTSYSISGNMNISTDSYARLATTF